MKKILLLSILTLSISVLYAENIDDYYVSRQTEAGLLFFIKPYEVPSQQKGIKPALFDITMLSTGDSVNLNVSIYYPSVLNADSIAIIHITDTRDSIRTIHRFETFFIDAEKNVFHHRCGIGLPYSYLKDLSIASEPYLFVVYVGDKAIKYGYSNKEWKQHRTRMGNLLKLFDNNRRQDIGAKK